MTVAYLFDPVKQFVSRNGIPLAGGFLNVFIGESQEPASTYSDAAGTVINPRNIPIDSAGRALGVFVDDSKLYTLKAYNSGGQLQFSIYPVAPAKGGTSGGDSYYYPGDEFIHIDQDAREISLQNTKPIRGDEETIQMEDTADAVILHVNPDIIGDEMHVAAGEHTSVDYDSDNNTYTVNAEYASSDTVEIDSDGAIHGKYEGGYGIEIDGNVVKEKHHRLISTNAVSYNYCKVFDFTWEHVYGRGQCVFTAIHYGGSYVTFSVTLIRGAGADYTNAVPYVVSASPDMVKNYAFIERLEIREVGDRILGYLKLRNFIQNQFWLDWEGSSGAGTVSFTPKLTNSPEGTIGWTRTIDNNNVFYSQYDADSIFQKKLTAGSNITIDSDNVISAEDVFIAVYDNTLFRDIKSAITQGKYVVARQGSSYYVPNNESDSRVVFMRSLEASVNNYIAVDSDNIWTSTTVALPKTSFTAHGSVTTTDAYNDVGYTNSFAIGQKGTHGGVLDIGAKIGTGGWNGDYKVFTRLYHDSTSASAPASGSTSFGTVTLGTNYTAIGSVSQYLLMTETTHWTYIVELAYSASPGRSLRLTISGIGSTDITYFAEEIR